MKKIYLSLILAFIAVSTFAQSSVQALKSQVCIVREVYFDETKAFCTELSDTLNRSGYPNYAEYVENYIGKTFGSGFVYVAPDGKNYIITNRHVVSKCEGASIEFENPDGTTKKYENLTVIASDEDLDIAILAFENNAKMFKTGLSFAKSPASDGEDVWTAGYPGLNGQPVWQYAKGNITNSNVKINELLNPEISSLIQHSAPVDSGNSGGPLLRSKNGTYEVLGMNTWKFFYRQSANISIPSAAIQKFINDALSKKADDSAEALKTRIGDMKKLFDAEEVYFRDLSKFVSFDYAKREGAKSFVKNMKTATSNDRNSIRGAFTSYSPIEGITYSVSLDVYKMLSSDDFIKTAEIGDPVKNSDGNYNVKITSKNRSLDTTWTFETLGSTGFWRLSDCKVAEDGNNKKSSSKAKKDSKDSGEKKSSGSSKNSSSKSGVKLESPYKLSTRAGIVPDDPVNFGAGFFIKPFDFFGLEVTGFGQKIGGSSAAYFAMNAVLELPIAINDFAIIPYAEGGFSMGGSMDNGFNFGMGHTIEVGAKIGYTIGSFFPFAYCAWSRVSENIRVDFDDISASSNGIAAGLGVGFHF